MKGIRIVFAAAVIAAPLAAQEKAKFEPKLDKEFFQSVTTTVKQTITVQGGSELSLNHSQTFLFKWTPGKVEGDKTTMKLKIEGMKLNVDIATNPVKYDSTSDKPDGNNATLTEFFKGLKDTEFTVTFGKNGVVEKVDGRDEFLKKLGNGNPQMEGILKKILTDESLKEMSDPMAGLTPAVAPPATTEKAANEAWEKKSSLPLGPIGSYDRTLKFTSKGKDTKDGLYLVEVSVDLAYKPPAETADGLLFRIKSGKLDPINPKPGFFKFDAAKGYVKEAELNVSLKGTLKVALGNTAETDVELFQEQKTTIKTQDTTFLPPLLGPTPGPGVPPVAPPPMPPKQ